jgi:hypothetical protein
MGNINALGIRDRILVYDKNFSYADWQEELSYLIGEDYEYVADSEDEYRIFNLVKPDETARILSTPNTLEEYLNRSYYSKYVEHLTGDWVIEGDWQNGRYIIIKTDDLEGMYDIIEDQYVADNKGNEFYTSTKRIVDGLIYVETNEYGTSDTLDPILLGMADVIDLQYPVQLKNKD